MGPESGSLVRKLVEKLCLGMKVVEGKLRESGSNSLCIKVQLYFCPSLREQDFLVYACLCGLGEGSMNMTKETKAVRNTHTDLSLPPYTIKAITR